MPSNSAGSDGVMPGCAGSPPPEYAVSQAEHTVPLSEDTPLPGCAGSPPPEYAVSQAERTVPLSEDAPPPGRGEAVVNMMHIHKRFKNVNALSDVSFGLHAGEVRALVGENGAGKSTLMNILYGMYSPTSGSIECFGESVPNRWTSIQAIARGIGMIHQHFSSVPAYTALENVVLPLLRWRDIRPDWVAHRRRIEALQTEYAFNLDLDQRVEDMSVGGKQQLEILKALYQGARILILDEPTGVLTPQQAANLFRFIAELKRKRYSVVMVTHKLEEAMEVCDTITVLRNGNHIDTVEKKNATPHALARMMIERDYIVTISRNPLPKVRKPVLAVNGLTVKGADGKPALDQVSFEVNSGEILGIAGVAGNGQEALATAIVGLRDVDQGSIVLEGRDITKSGVRKRKEQGIGYIPEDRHRSGLVLQMTVAENLILDRLGAAPFSKYGFISLKRVTENSDGCIGRYRIKTPGSQESVVNLSGGNQQKVVLARAITANPKIMVTCQPSWGLDFGATEFVREELVAHAASGTGVLLISSDLSELIELSHRILVLFGGKIVGSMDHADINLEKIGMMMAGVLK